MIQRLSQLLKEKFNSFRLFWVCLFIFNISTVSAQKPEQTSTSDFDIVFCLDLSGSTNGLIDNVRENIWSVINQVSSFQPKQNLRIGVVGFSRPSFGKSSAYVKVLSRLTDDFDQMAADLWKLKPEVEKGDQFVSNALEKAGFEMNWSKSKDAVKIMFLIGNGNVNTGSSDYRSVVTSITNKGIHLVPVYCMRTKQTRETDGWQQIGRMTGYFYEPVWITKNEPLIKPVPATEKLISLAKELNKQVVPYTKIGVEKFNNITTCDQKALLLSPVAFENRFYYRISNDLFQNVSKWDLVDAGYKDASDLLKADLSLVTDSLRRANLDDLFYKLQYKRENRNRIISEIKKLLPQSRQEYINELVSRETFDQDQNIERVLLKNISKIASEFSIQVK